MSPPPTVEEHAFTCPYCWERITMLLEPVADGRREQQSYVEDCEVCCNPIRITYVLGRDGLESFAAVPIEQ